MSSTTLRQYSSAKVKAHYLGMAITGLGPGTAISAERNEANGSYQVGVDRSIGKYRAADQTGTITLVLQQTSPFNSILSALQIAQDVRDEFISGAFTVADPSGSFLMKASGVHINEPATMEISDEYGTKTWVFHCDELTYLEVAQTGTLDAKTAEKVSQITSAGFSVVDGLIQ